MSNSVKAGIATGAADPELGGLFLRRLVSGLAPERQQAILGGPLPERQTLGVLAARKAEPEDAPKPAASLEERLADFRRGLDEIARGWDGGRQSPPTTEPRDGDGITYGRKPDGRPYASGPVPPPAMPEATEVGRIREARRPIMPGPSGTLPPVDFPKIRVDREGDGNYESGRTHGRHSGVDLEVPPGEAVKSPVEGRVERIGSAYKKEADPFDGKYRTIWIRGLDGNLYGLGYAVPTDKDGAEVVKPGDKVAAGQVVGSMQNRAQEAKSGLMKNHMHFSIVGRDGREIDPTPLFREWTGAFKAPF